MGLILITQFNSFYQAFLILSAVLFSTVGVFLGLLVFQRPFGIVMSGIGVIALAGIVVNNNIVLIDTYNQLRKTGLDKVTAIMHTGAQRLRPVMLTTITTILGLMPMVLEMNIDLINRNVAFGAPSTQWWTQLATAIAGGLAFATLLTLILTPCLLMLGRDKHLMSSKGTAEQGHSQQARHADGSISAPQSAQNAAKPKRHTASTHGDPSEIVQQGLSRAFSPAAATATTATPQAGEHADESTK
ncbi:RND multidrug efflux transporter [Photobacterium aphoticum]|uniref:RND multidrug efflux transporter n=1 Tax=Photobacterium aphoticum TaxID=754436 RepID=A0A090QUX5_9GAMM|nr:RND multidrug efflux transporter [Photobacterium aphoticum]